MNRIAVLPLSVALLLTICLPGGAAQQVQISSKPNPQIEKILSEISPANIEAVMRKLVGFGTRHTLSSQDDPARGVGAAWRWIKQEMDRYSRESGGRLIVTTDEFVQQPTQFDFDFINSKPRLVAGHSSARLVDVAFAYGG